MQCKGGGSGGAHFCHREPPCAWMVRSCVLRNGTWPKAGEGCGQEGHGQYVACLCELEALQQELVEEWGEGGPQDSEWPAWAVMDPSVWMMGRPQNNPSMNNPGEAVGICSRRVRNDSWDYDCHDSSAAEDGNADSKRSEHRIQQRIQPCGPYGLKATDAAGSVLYQYLQARGLVHASTHFAKRKYHTWTKAAVQGQAKAEQQTEYIIVQGRDLERVADCGRAIRSSGSNHDAAACTSNDRLMWHGVVQCTLRLTQVLKKGAERNTSRGNQKQARRQQEQQRQPPNVEQYGRPPPKRGIRGWRKLSYSAKSAATATTETASSSGECGPPLVKSVRSPRRTNGITPTVPASGANASASASASGGHRSNVLQGLSSVDYVVSPSPIEGHYHTNQSVCTECGCAALPGNLHMDLVDCQWYCEGCFERLYGQGWRAHTEERRVNGGDGSGGSFASRCPVAPAPTLSAAFGDVVISSSGNASSMNVGAQAWTPPMSVEASARASLGPGAVERERERARARRLAATCQ
jgi:hypothetical protein